MTLHDETPQGMAGFQIIQRPIQIHSNPLKSTQIISSQIKSFLGEITRTVNMTIFWGGKQDSFWVEQKCSLWKHASFSQELAFFLVISRVLGVRGSRGSQNTAIYRKSLMRPPNSNPLFFSLFLSLCCRKSSPGETLQDETYYRGPITL